MKEERQKIFAESQAHIEDLRAQIAAKRATVKAAEEALAKLTTARDDLQQKLENISLGKYPGPTASFPFVADEWQPKIPKIRQVVLEEFDRNNYNQPVARVDRCTSCHVGINKPGFEDQPNPWKTHPRRELFLGKHDPDKFGCTPCHNGDGTAVNSEHSAHATTTTPTGTCTRCTCARSSRCSAARRCRPTASSATRTSSTSTGRQWLARGEKLFVELGCHGCHLAEGYEDLAKEHGISAVGPSLRRIAAKDDPAWMVRWITNPHEIRPRTRMPNFMFTPEQAEQITAYLLDVTKAPSRSGSPAIRTRTSSGMPRWRSRGGS